MIRASLQKVIGLGQPWSTTQHIYILIIYVPSTHAYTHVLRLSLDLPYETRSCDCIVNNSSLSYPIY